MAKRISVAYSNPENLNKLAGTLKNSGYDVFKAEDGRQLIKIINVNQVPDLVILNETLQKIDTLGVCKELRREKRTQRVPILVLKGKDFDEKPLRDVGISEFVDKSSGTTHFLERIGVLLGEKGKGCISKAAQKNTMKAAGIFVVILCLIILMAVIIIPLLRS